jgi:hypothetical protein
MPTDFTDRDLQTPSPRRVESPLAQGLGIRTAPEGGADRMTRHKEEISTHMSGAVSELERLRLRQDELEREKRSLEDLSRKQAEYEAGKRDIIEKLNRSAILLEKEETQANRMAELLAETRDKFQETLAELKAIKEEAWGDADFRVELSRALAKVEAGRETYKRAMAKIDASSWHKVGGKMDAMPEVARESFLPLGFGGWLKIGIAVTIPLAVVLVLMFVAYLVVTSGMFFPMRGGLR